MTMDISPIQLSCIGMSEEALCSEPIGVVQAVVPEELVERFQMAMQEQQGAHWNASSAVETGTVDSSLKSGSAGRLTKEVSCHGQDGNGFSWHGSRAMAGCGRTDSGFTDESNGSAPAVPDGRTVAFFPSSEADDRHAVEVPSGRLAVASNENGHGEAAVQSYAHVKQLESVYSVPVVGSELKTVPADAQPSGVTILSASASDSVPVVGSDPKVSAVVAGASGVSVSSVSAPVVGSDQKMATPVVADAAGVSVSSVSAPVVGSDQKMATPVVADAAGVSDSVPVVVSDQKAEPVVVKVSETSISSASASVSAPVVGSDQKMTTPVVADAAGVSDSVPVVGSDQKMTTPVVADASGVSDSVPVVVSDQKAEPVVVKVSETSISSASASVFAPVGGSDQRPAAGVDASGVSVSSASASVFAPVGGSDQKMATPVVADASGVSDSVPVGGSDQRPAAGVVPASDTSVSLSSPSVPVHGGIAEQISSATAFRPFGAVEGNMSEERTAAWKSATVNQRADAVAPADSKDNTVVLDVNEEAKETSVAEHQTDSVPNEPLWNAVFLQAAPVAVGVEPAGMMPAGISPLQETTAAQARIQMLNEAVEAVCEAIQVTPGLRHGEGEMRIQLKADVLDGTVIELKAIGTALSVVFHAVTSHAQQLLEQNISQFEAHLAGRIHNVQIAVMVKKEKQNERV